MSPGSVMLVMNWLVAPFTGAWIEMLTMSDVIPSMSVSHPSRVRGLKLQIVQPLLAESQVAPFTGAWIEIENQGRRGRPTGCVAPFTGAWIEMTVAFYVKACVARSHPSRVRGLK